MLARFGAYWDNLRSSLWFTPTVIVAAAAGVAWSVLRLDRWAASSDIAVFAWAFGGGPESARQLLATLAGSMITLTGVTFSITLAALTLAAGQYSPRILRNFMRDRFNQTVLGVFIGTFVYCILLLRTVRVGDEPYVPDVGVTLGILLAILSLAFFIFFIHHMARSIQVSSMIQAVGNETHHAIESLFERERAPAGPGWIRTELAPLPDGHPVLASRDGYVERMDTERLCEAASREGLVLEMLVGPGDFVTARAPVAITDPAPGDADAFGERVRSALFLGRQRTMAQDPAFGFRQLVDIAVRSLSPGINDPTTACNAIDYLGSLLADMADRTWPVAEWVDETGVVRLRVPRSTFHDYVTLACTEVRRYGAGDIAATLRLLDMLGIVAVATDRPDRRAPLWKEALAIVTGAAPHLDVDGDRQRVNDRLQRVAQTLGEDAVPHFV